MFLDGPGRRPATRSTWFSPEKRADRRPGPVARQVNRSGRGGSVPVDLEPLVRMKLTSYRLKDRVHLLDMIDVGLIDHSWPAKFQPELGSASASDSRQSRWLSGPWLRLRRPLYRWDVTPAEARAIQERLRGRVSQRILADPCDMLPAWISA